MSVDSKKNVPFSYAKAASGTSVVTPVQETSPGLNGKIASTPASGQQSPATTTPASEKASIVPPPNQATHSRKSSVSSSVATQPAWANKGAIHMPTRPGQFSANPSPVQFGNLANPGPVQAKSPSNKPAAIASGGNSAPAAAIQGKDLVQFGSITPGSEAVHNVRQPSHSRAGSNASDFNRPTINMSPRGPHANMNNMQYPIFNAQQYAGGYSNQYPVAMPNMPMGQYRGQQRPPQGNMNFQQPNQRPPASPRNSHQSPMSTPQQQRAQMSSPMTPGSGYAAYPVYNQQHQMFYPGYGYDPSMYQNQAMYQNTIQSPRAGPQYGQQYGGANVASAPGMSRSGSQVGERPQSSTPSNAGTPAPPAFITPAKKKSSAIKIMDPNSKQEIALPKTPIVVESKRDNVVSPVKETRPASASGLTPRPNSSASTDTTDEIKRKQDAARAAVLAKIAAAQAPEREAEEKRVAKEKEEAAAKELAEKEAAERKLAEEALAKQKAEEEAAAAVAIAAKKAEEEAAVLAAAAAAEKKAEENRLAKEAEEKQKAEEEAQRVEQEQKETAAKAEKEKDAASDVIEIPSINGLNTIAEAPAQNQKADYQETKPPTDISSEESKVDLSKQTEALETSESSQPLERKERPSPLNLSKTINPDQPIPSAPLTALRTSRRIEDLKEIQYPAGIKSPNPEINKNAQAGKYKYDKDFLLQFQKAYSDKPTFDWDQKIRDTIGDPDSKQGKMGGRQSSNRGSTASPFAKDPLGFSNPKPAKTSEERFKQSQQAASVSFDRGANFKPSNSRSNSSFAPPSPGGREANRSKRGAKGDRAHSRKENPNQVGAPTIAPEDVKPLENSANKWDPRAQAVVEPALGDDPNYLAPEVVQRKVKGLLNKLTLDNFERITDQILEIASQSKVEQDGRTLRQVIALTFEKATDEAHFSNVYARFSRKMMEKTDDSIIDSNVKDKHGVHVKGGTLFRKYLLSRCQEDFEKGWKTQLPPKPDGEPQNEEAAMLSDEYYLAATAKRRGLGLVRFIGELYKLGMLNEKIMHECIKKLLANITDPEEEEVESLAKLVTTVGPHLEVTERGAAHMSAYIERMQVLTTCKSLTSRIQFMVMDVIDLRAANWIGKETNKGPKTIEEIHADAAKEAAAKEAARPQRGGGPRPDFGRGDGRIQSNRRQDSHGPTVSADGWTNVKTAAREPERRAGDFSKFGSFRSNSKAGGAAPGPGGNLMGFRTNSNQRQASASGGTSSMMGSREPSRAADAPTNAFAALEGNNGEPEEEDEELKTPKVIPDDEDNVYLPPDDVDTSARPKLNLRPKGASAPGATKPAEAAPVPATAEEEEDVYLPPDDVDTSQRPRLNLKPKGA